MRPLVVALLLSVSLGACSRLFGGSTTDAVQSVPITADSTLRIAATQLQHHGYSVTPVGARTLMTVPRPVPAWLGEQDGSMKARQWFVQVSVEPHYLARGTRLEVVGYLVPESATRPASGTTPNVQNAIPVTSEHRLYQEVRTIASWIGDAARRK
jgi:hypothetical protein